MQVDEGMSVSIAPGASVLVRDAEWNVTSVAPVSDGSQKVTVRGTSGLVRDQSATFFTNLDRIEVLDPRATRVVADESARFRRSRLWLESQIRKTPVGSASAQLSVSTQMLAKPLGYQRRAVSQVLDPENLRPRVLIADAVGLGKTIEIGMILAELVRRGRGERILVVTPKHVLEQMQHEMWTRFGLPFVRLDSVGIQRVRQKLPASRNPFSMYKRAIISIDTLKQPKYRAHLEKQHWDAVVVDEAHNVTGQTQNNALVRVLAQNTEALVLASATPHNGRKESFAEMIRLLEPSAVSPRGEIDDGRLKYLVIRRHRGSDEVKSEVGSDWAPRRDPQNFMVPASPAENAIADELSRVWLHPESGSSPYSGATSALFPWTLAKAFLSSTAALNETVRNRIREASKSVGGASEVHALKRLQTLGEQVSHANSSKFEHLVAYLRGIGISSTSDERVVVFSERVASLHWLEVGVRDALKLNSKHVRVLHGQLSDTEQQDIVEDFKRASSKIRVLVTGDVASEGVNLHAHCHELVHYDIPWSLIRIEQRNGRIDRYGQREGPQITTLLLTPENEDFAGDVGVLTRLLKREREAHDTLGDVASLMGEFTAEAEEKAIKKALARGADIAGIVRTPEEVQDGDDWFAMMLGAQDEVVDVPVDQAPAATGLFTSDAELLYAAVSEAHHDQPELSEARGGIGWVDHAGHGVVEFNPPAELKSVLQTLPQTYLSERRVTSKLTLATRQTTAEQALDEARNSPNSQSLWPEAHYLGPLHPVLDWAMDKALGNADRGTIFAVTGGVDVHTVLHVGILTNRAGQVVATNWTTTFSLGAGITPLSETHATAAAAIDALGLSAQNVGQDIDVDALNAMISDAVDAAKRSVDEQLRGLIGAVDDRVSVWVSRTRSWEDEAEQLHQLEGLKKRAATVEEERRMIENLRPDRSFVRPLLVVVPKEDA